MVLRLLLGDCDGRRRTPSWRRRRASSPSLPCSLPRPALCNSEQDAVFLGALTASDTRNHTGQRTIVRRQRDDRGRRQPPAPIGLLRSRGQRPFGDPGDPRGRESRRQNWGGCRYPPVREGPTLGRLISAAADCLSGMTERPARRRRSRKARVGHSRQHGT